MKINFLSKPDDRLSFNFAFTCTLWGRTDAYVGVNTVNIIDFMEILWAFGLWYFCPPTNNTFKFKGHLKLDAPRSIASYAESWKCQLMFKDLLNESTRESTESTGTEFVPVFNVHRTIDQCVVTGSCDSPVRVDLFHLSLIFDLKENNLIIESLIYSRCAIVIDFHPHHLL